MIQRRNSQDPQEGGGRLRSVRYAGMGLELAGAIIGLTLAGYWVDLKFDTRPIGLTVGAVVGIVGGMYNFIRQAIALSAEQSDSQSRHDSDRNHDRSESE